MKFDKGGNLSVFETTLQYNSCETHACTQEFDVATPPNTIPGQANATPKPKSHKKDASKQKT